MARSLSLSALVVLVAACGSGTQPSTPHDEAPAPVANAAPDKDGGPVVALIAAGAEPRRTLRYAPTKGARDRVEMVMTMGMAMTMAGTTIPKVEMPPMTMVMDTEVTSANAESFDVAAKVTDIRVADGVDPAVTAAIKKEVGAMIGMTMTMTMSRRGVLQQADLAVPAGVNPQVSQMMETMKQSMAQVTPPFPELPVGIGARWTSTSKLEVNSLKLTQTAAFELTKLDEGRGTARIDLDQLAPPQDVNPPGTPPGVTSHLDSLATKGSGTLSFDLSRVMPAAATLHSSSAMQMTMHQGAQTSGMSMTMDIAMDLTSSATK